MWKEQGTQNLLVKLSLNNFDHATASFFTLAFPRKSSSARQLADGVGENSSSLCPSFSFRRFLNPQSLKTQARPEALCPTPPWASRHARHHRQSYRRRLRIV
jgi:hypothetical protein